jgi:hypothetical protein
MVTTNPPARAPSRFRTKVPNFCRLPPIRSLTLRARSRSLVGLDPCCAYQACKNSKICCRSGSSDLMSAARCTGSTQPSASKGSRHHEAHRSKLPSGMPGRRLVCRPQRQIVRTAASRSARCSLIEALKSSGNRRYSGFSHLASRLTTRKRRVKSSEIRTAFPVTTINAFVVKGTILVCPSGRVVTTLSVMT